MESSVLTTDVFNEITLLMLANLTSDKLGKCPGKMLETLSLMCLSEVADLVPLTPPPFLIPPYRCPVYAQNGTNGME